MPSKVSRSSDAAGSGHARAEPGVVRRLEQGLNSSVSGNAQAFGFSITITVSYGVCDLVQPTPGLVDLLVFALAGVAAFAGLNIAVVALLGSDCSDNSSTRAMLVGTATDFIAVGGAVGAAIGINQLVTRWPAWLLTPFAAGIVYVLVQSVELAIGRSEADDD